MTIPDDLEQDLERFVRSQEVPPALTAIVQTALRRLIDGASHGDGASLIRRVLSNRRAIVDAGDRHGVSEFMLFGSVARGEERDDSDVDLAVATSPGTTLFDLARLRSELEEMLDAPVDLVTSAGLSDSERVRLATEAIRL